MPFGWVAGAAALGAVGTVAAGAMQSGAVSDAADSAANTQRGAQAQGEAHYQQGRTDQMPYMDAGKNALAPAQNLLGINGPDAAKAAMDNFQASPGYQYTFDQAMRAVNSNSAAAGMAASGANLKALQDRGAQVANQEFGNYYNRLMGLTSLGQNAAAGVGNNGMQTANINSNAAAGIAQTQAGAGTAQASIYGNTASGLGNQANNFASNYLYDQKTNALYGGNVQAPQLSSSGWGAVGPSGYL